MSIIRIRRQIEPLSVEEPLQPIENASFPKQLLFFSSIASTTSRSRARALQWRKDRDARSREWPPSTPPPYVHESFNIRRWREGHERNERAFLCGRETFTIEHTLFQTLTRAALWILARYFKQKRAPLGKHFLTSSQIMITVYCQTLWSSNTVWKRQQAFYCKSSRL